MRILVIPFPSPAHFNAMVPLLGELHAAGHELLVGCQPDLTDAVHGAGFISTSVGEAANTIEGIVANTSPDMFPAEAFGDRESDMGAMLWRIIAQGVHDQADRYVDDYAALIRAWRPDAVLYDRMAVAGLLAAEANGVPAVAHRWGLDPLTGPFTEELERSAAPIVERLGLDGFPAPGLILDPVPPSLQIKDAHPAHHIRYAPFNGAGDLPDWAVPSDGLRRVAVCMGGNALLASGPRPLVSVLRALGDADGVEVVVLAAPELAQDLPPLPENIRRVDPTPLDLFLDTCDVLVHHGGSQTGLTGTWFGVPQLVLPQWQDQFDYGRLLEAAGAGLCAPSAEDQADTDALRRSVLSLFGEESRAAVQRLRAEMDTGTPLHGVSRLISDLRRP